MSFVAEHYARYRWAAEVVAGRRVLDAGCGVGSGSAQLAARAREVTGIDPSPEAIAVAEHEHGQVATFRQGDLLDLPFRDGELDAIVCFEAIERVTDAERALDELQRVLDPDGLLVIRSPGADLRARFAHVAIHHQQTHLASLLCDEATLRHDDPTQPIHPITTKATATSPRESAYTIVTATNGRPPDHPGPQIVLTAAPTDEELETWRQRALRADSYLAIAEIEMAWEDHVDRRSIVHAKARQEELAARLAKLERECRDARTALDAMRGSASWRATAPLRRLKRLSRLPARG